MAEYLKPELKVFSASDFEEMIGPVQTAYGTMNVQGWRGTKFEQPVSHEVRLAANKNSTFIFTAKEVENA
jgi:hypothetical protein